MGKSIAEQLLQAAVTLHGSVGTASERDSLDTYSASWRRAMAYVSEVYGPPCKNFKGPKIVDPESPIPKGIDALRPSGGRRHMDKPIEQCRPGEECVSCEWPLSAHPGFWAFSED